MSMSSSLPPRGTGLPASAHESHGIVTPEAVVLDFETAGVGSRIAAAFVDGIVRFGLLLVMLLAGGALGAATSDLLPSWVGVTIIILAGALLSLGYPVLFEAFWNGRTPGKAALGLRVVTVEGAPIRLRHAAIRGAIGVVELLACSGALAAVVVFLTGRHQRLGDLAAGTLVLRERSAANVPTAVRFNAPPGAEAYVETLDVSSLNTDQYLAVRSYLVRAPTLTGAARHQLAEQLATGIARQVPTAPVEGLTAEGFLLCIATAYQHRFSDPG